MNLFKRKKKEEPLSVQTAVSDSYQGSGYSYLGMNSAVVYERKLYRFLRESVPLIDAAIAKLVRLVGSFRVSTGNPRNDAALAKFLREVQVNGCARGIDSFLAGYLDQLLTYGTAVGEMVLSRNGKNIAALYQASLDHVELTADGDPLNIRIRSIGPAGARKDIPYPGLVLCTTLMNEPGKVYGTSVLRGLPFVGEILLKIFHAVGTNWERVGNVRFAVSYKPGENERSFSRDRAAQIASEWSKAMKSREPKDFVTVGDVSIRVIGADNQIPDSQVPVRMLLEQIVSKLSIPPFLLGLTWSSTERMSSQQADILTSELEFYRRQLEGCISRICGLFLKLRGEPAEFRIEWDNINLQDEVELARARLLNAQADAVKKGE